MLSDLGIGEAEGRRRAEAAIVDGSALRAYETWIRAQGGDPRLEALPVAPVVVDVYEFKKSSSGIRLRKSSTTRWFLLSRTSVASRCTATGGTNGVTMGGADCTCPTTQTFVPGAGGCIAMPGANETKP